MQGEIINHIYCPKDENDWILVETSGGLYSLRLGGFKKEEGKIEPTEYNELELPFTGSIIEEVYTDSETLYIILNNGNMVKHGWAYQYFGDNSMDVFYNSMDVFYNSMDVAEHNSFKDELTRLVLGKDGTSVEV